MTKDKNTHGQSCKKCKKKLTTVQDYIGGGSHYWLLKCNKCERFYAFDTYGFVLRNMVDD